MKFEAYDVRKHLNRDDPNLDDRINNIRASDIELDRRKRGNRCVKFFKEEMPRLPFYIIQIVLAIGLFIGITAVVSVPYLLQQLRPDFSLAVGVIYGIILGLCITVTTSSLIIVNVLIDDKYLKPRVAERRYVSNLIDNLTKELNEIIYIVPLNRAFRKFQLVDQQYSSPLLIQYHYQDTEIYDEIMIEDKIINEYTPELKLIIDEVKQLQHVDTWKTLKLYEDILNKYYKGEHHNE